MTSGRLLLIALMLWGLAMVVPDLLRVVSPLGSFGFYADNDGVVSSVTGPFADEHSSPAWQAGLRVGDHLDLSRLRCSREDVDACRNALAALGGLQFVLPGTTLEIDILAKDGRPDRHIVLVAQQRPSNLFVRFVLILTQIASILVIVAAAWLVWSRPSAMSWGFFLYVNWFNPGQAYAYYAILQQWPVVLIAQDIAGCIAQAAGFAGLLLFAIRAPRNETEPMWRPVERALPFVAGAFAVLLIASYASLFGYPTEMLTRAGIIAGFAVALTAIVILLVRMPSQKPEDYQRLRWVLWGCLIGLPSFLLAELASETTFFDSLGVHFTPTDDMIGLLYLVNGVLCLFVFEALTRDRVVSVWIPLRRVTILTLLLTPLAIFLHHEIQRIEAYFELPDWAWLVVAVLISFFVSKLHDGAVDLADGFFNRWLDRIEERLAAAIRGATSATEIERVLADETFHALKLTSAASFRHNGAVLSREGNGKGWDDYGQELKLDAPLLAPLREGAPFKVRHDDADGLALPQGIARPVLAVPARTPARCFALSLYGPHASGTDLDHNERAMLSRIAQDAAAIYAELEGKELRRQIAELERELQDMKLAVGSVVPR